MPGVRIQGGVAFIGQTSRRVAGREAAGLAAWYCTTPKQPLVNFRNQPVAILESLVMIALCRILQCTNALRKPQGPVAAPASNQRPMSARSASVICVELFMGISFCTTTCW